MAGAAKVALIGATVAKQLFGASDPYVTRRTMLGLMGATLSARGGSGVFRQCAMSASISGATPG